MAFLGILKESEKPKAPKSRPRILIGVAGFHGVVPEAQENFFELAYHCGRRMPEYDFFLRILIKREQFRARNNLVDLALINGCDYLLMLDDDMIVPNDLLSRLIAHGKDVTGALYFQRGGAYHPVLMRSRSRKDGLRAVEFIQHHDEIVRRPGLHDLSGGVLGGGCLLFKTDVFRKIPQPYFWIDGIVGTDVHICQQLANAGVSLWVDSSIELGHVGESQIVTSRTIPHYAAHLGEANERLWNDLKGYLMCGDEELESRIVQASFGNARQEVWEKKPRETWEAVRAYYQEEGEWGLANLAMYNLKYDQARDWAINDMPKVAKPGATVVDYGAGLGYVTIEAAKRGYQVIAMDLDKTKSFDFLAHRIKEHKLPVQTVGFETPVPPDLGREVDGVLMISVLDHLWDPWGALQWVHRHVKRGGFLLCDTFHAMRKDGEPQHICKFDPHKVDKDFKALGWRSVPDNPYLFLKE